MRAIVTVLILLLAAPAAGALALPAPVPSAPVELSDGQLLRLVARELGLAPQVPAVRAADASELPALVARLAARSGGALSEAEAAVAFAALDVRVAAPVATLLLAIDEAWTLRDAAFADVTVEDLHAQWRLHQEGAPGVGLSPAQQEQLMASAILLADTLDAIVLPQLDALADQPVWPPIPLADPVGVLRIGSSGDDTDTLDRLLSIDGTGRDTYKNNAGATTILMDFDPATPDYPVTLLLDLRGDDIYQRVSAKATLAGAFLGVGIFHDLSGSDRYVAGDAAIGAGITGVGYFRDHAGDDSYSAYFEVIGMGASGGIGIAREDAGFDHYLVSGFALGHGEATNGAPGLGLFWDRSGRDEYLFRIAGNGLGWARNSARGWFVDDGPATDLFWDVQFNRPYHQGCNTCTWSAGSNNSPTTGGRGNDNFGGLPYLFAHQDTH